MLKLPTMEAKRYVQSMVLTKIKAFNVSRVPESELLEIVVADIFTGQSSGHKCQSTKGQSLINTN